MSKRYCVMKQNLRMTSDGTRMPKQWEVPIQIADSDGRNGGNVVAFVYGCHTSEACMEIANLFSASGDLLDALKGLVSGECHCDESQSKCVECVAYAAIEKAEGLTPRPAKLERNVV